MFSDYQAGFDSHTTLLDDEMNRHHFYAQVKIRFPFHRDEGRDQTIDEVIAHTVGLTLLHHICRYAPYDNLNDVDLNLNAIHVILYNWGDDGRVKPNKDEVLSLWKKVYSRKNKAFKSQAIDKLGMQEVPKHFKSVVLRYLENHFNNIHVVARPILEKWLLPSLLPIPMLVDAVTVEKEG